MPSRHVHAEDDGRKQELNDGSGPLAWLVTLGESKPATTALAVGVGHVDLGGWLEGVVVYLAADGDFTGKDVPRVRVVFGFESEQLGRYGIQTALFFVVAMDSFGG